MSNAASNTAISIKGNCTQGDLPPAIHARWMPTMQEVYTKTLDEAPLPVDFLLLTVKDCEFLACYKHLISPFRCWYDQIGFVYFGDVGGDQDEKMKVSLIRCGEGSSGPGGALVTLKSAVPLLRPKAIISVGTCSSLNTEEARLGDVVVSAKLSLPYGMRCVSRRFLSVIKHVADGFNAPLQNPQSREIKIHCDGTFLSSPELVNAESQYKLLSESFPQATGIALEGEGIFVAAFDDQIEWLIVKGIADYADGAESTTENWNTFASVMAASVVAHILSDPNVFRSWGHCHTERDASSTLQSPARGILKRKWFKEDEDTPSDLQSPSQGNRGMEKTKSRQHADASHPALVVKKNCQVFKSGEVPLGGEFTFSYLKDIFSRLGIGGKEKTQGTLTDEITNMTAIFKAHKDCQTPRTVLIEGDPGMGKTTYCQKLAYDWATKQDEWDESFPETDVLLLLRCRDIKSKLAVDWATDSVPRNRPLNTVPLCFLSEDFRGDLPVNKTQLHIETVLRVLHGYEKKNGLSSRSEDLIRVYKKELLLLGRVALQSLLEGGSNLEEHEFGLNSGLLSLSIQGGDSESKPCNPYGYYDRSMQEFFSALYLAFQILDGEIDCGSVLSDERYLNLNQVLLFMTGIVASQCEETAVILVNSLTAQINSLDSKSYTRVGSFLQFAFDCLSECTACIAKHSQPRLVHTFGRNLNIATLQLAGFKHIELLFEALSVNSSLTSLNLRGSSVGDSSVFPVSNALSVNSSLTNLDLTSNGIGDTSAKSLSQALKVNSSLTNLNLSGNSIGHTGAESLSLALTVNSSLTNLDLSGNSIGHTGAESLSLALTVNSSLTNLDLSGNSIGHAGAEFLSQALIVNSSLTDLDLSGNNIGDTGAESLAQNLTVNSSLTNLNLSGNGIGLVGVACLSHALIVNSSLTNLDLSWNSIGDTGVFSLSQALKVNSSLTNLDLSGNSIGDTGVFSLSQALTVNSPLTNLDLSGNSIDDTGVCSLSQVLKVNTSLTNLDLSGNSIGDIGVCSLSQALKVNTSLTNLDLSGNSIGYVGVCSLSQAIKVNSSLTNLDLSYNSISDTVLNPFPRPSQ